MNQDRDIAWSAYCWRFLLGCTTSYEPWTAKGKPRSLWLDWFKDETGFGFCVLIGVRVYTFGVLTQRGRHFGCRFYRRAAAEKEGDEE